MILRRGWNALCRGLLRWQLVAVPVLPLWIIVGFGVFGGAPSGLFLTMVGSMVLFVFLAVLALLTRLRPAMRGRPGLGVADAVLTVAFSVAMVGLGFFGSTGVAFAIVGVVLGLGLFWLTVAELAREWRDRVNATVRKASAAPAPSYRERRRGPRPGGGDGDVIVVHETGR